MRIRREVSVCPPGTLGKLPHQGFAALPNGYRNVCPLWFVPWFEENDSIDGSTLKDPTSVERLCELMRRHGFRRHSNPRVFSDALKICSDETQRDIVLQGIIQFFRSHAVLIPDGLSSLPVAWLKALPGILSSLRKPHWTHLPFMIREMEASDGHLQLRFAQEGLGEIDFGRVTAWDKVRVAVNASLYPSCWRPLTSKHALLIKSRWPAEDPASLEPLIQ